MGRINNYKEKVLSYCEKEYQLYLSGKISHRSSCSEIAKGIQASTTIVNYYTNNKENSRALNWQKIPQEGHDFDVKILDRVTKEWEELKNGKRYFVSSSSVISEEEGATADHINTLIKNTFGPDKYKEWQALPNQISETALFIVNFVIEENKAVRQNEKIAVTSYEEIGKLKSITRERVRQILKRYLPKVEFEFHKTAPKKIHTKDYRLVENTVVQHLTNFWTAKSDEFLSVKEWAEKFEIRSTLFYVNLEVETRKMFKLMVHMKGSGGKTNLLKAREFILTLKKEIENYNANKDFRLSNNTEMAQTIKVTGPNISRWHHKLLPARIRELRRQVLIDTPGIVHNFKLKECSSQGEFLSFLFQDNQ